jgi:OmcA/MtrC family decaheme c-type cytochrome
MDGKLWFKTLLAGLMLTALVVAGCDDGDDGRDGAPGASAYEIAVENGFEGTEEEWLDSLGAAAATTAEIETCAVCHNSIEQIHEIMDISAITNVASEIDAVTGDLVITFNVELDGELSNDFILRRAYKSVDDPTLVAPAAQVQITSFRRDTITGDVVLTNDGLGGFTATVPAAVVEPDSTYLIQLESTLGASDERPVVVVTNGASHLRDLVTDAACAKCHGDYPAWSEKFRHYAVGGSDCQICHSQFRRTTGFIARDAAGDLFVQDLVDADGDTLIDEQPIVGTNLAEYIHGIHNSHNMPEETYFRTTAPDDADNIEDRYSLGFPSDMRNCSVCHEDDGVVDRNEVVASEPVSYYLCFTCHNNWDNFTPAVAAGGPLQFHQSMGPQTDCMATVCHGGLPNKNEAADFHNSFPQPPDSHVDAFYRGEDVSFSNPDQVSFAIVDVTSDGSAVSFTWTASKLGAPVDPCNTNVAVGPTYQELGAYLAYAKGDDWVNEFVGSVPGQPNGAQGLFDDLTTTCTNNVATTTGLVMDPEAIVYADKVLLAIGGKPADTFGPNGLAYFVREPSPTLAFNPADGSAATMRRSAVDNEKCLGCHQGTLYQHGGDRVDNEQLCVVCHNPSAGDKNNRLDRFQIVNADGTVNTDATYDGKNNETYDMRTMIHGIHGVSKRVPSTDSTSKPWTIYRSRGIYAFAPALYEDVILPGDDDFSTIAVEYPKPAGWPDDGLTINGSTNGSTIAHNWIVVHYPRPVNECMACHNDEAFEAPDQTKAVALTVDPGADYPDQSDDIVIGPAAAACTACHATAPTRIHATEDFGYRANVEKEVMLEKAAQ